MLCTPRTGKVIETGVLLPFQRYMCLHPQVVSMVIAHTNAETWRHSTATCPGTERFAATHVTDMNSS